MLDQVSHHWNKLTALHLQIEYDTGQINGTRFRIMRHQFQMALQQILQLMGPNANLMTVELNTCAYVDVNVDANYDYQSFYNNVPYDIIRSGTFTEGTVH